MIACVGVIASVKQEERLYIPTGTSPKCSEQTNTLTFEKESTYLPSQFPVP
jgi:hypothetical protein